jgi:hypothetical protein
MPSLLSMKRTSKAAAKAESSLKKLSFDELQHQDSVFSFAKEEEKQETPKLGPVTGVIETRKKMLDNWKNNKRMTKQPW